MRINEIFYSLQGEGFHTGTPAVFVRFSGCNLCCPFCDTQHQSFEELDEHEIVRRAASYPARFVVLTGGEPAMQVSDTLIHLLHAKGFTVAIETNGTLPLPDGIDWVTLSLKDPFLGPQAKPCLASADELKLLYDGQHDPAPYAQFPVRHARFLQPLDTGSPILGSRLLSETVAYIKEHPCWRLSLQTHKLLNIP
ncbi:MAG: radical SAM protein [Bacteroidales bacterium]|nr:radical SAM protein [Bacteroidales bacterium]